MSKKQRKRIIVLDTNVMVHDPEATLHFEEHTVVVPMIVIEELDDLKKTQDAAGASARHASRVLEELRLNNLKFHKHLRDGAQTPGGGRLFVDHMDWTDYRQAIDRGIKHDNLIIECARRWKERERGAEVVVLSKDTNMRLKCDGFGLLAENYNYDAVSDFGSMYTGQAELILSSYNAELMMRLCQNHRLEEHEALCIEGYDKLLFNQCCVLKYDDDYCLCVRKRDGLVHIGKNHRSDKISIHPANVEQAMAYHLMNDPSLSLVTLVGKAGTGKTLMSLLAAYERVVIRKQFSKILIFRPMVEVGEKLGFLPGNVVRKFQPWTVPITDNFSLIARQNRPKREAGNSDGKSNGHGEEEYIQQLIRDGLLEMNPIAYLRGRSIHNAFVIIDEAQNMTPHDLKMILTRAAKGTFYVLTGDPTQIDLPWLDERSNGLSYTAESLKGEEMVGHIKLTEGLRSPLAELAANRLSSRVGSRAR